MNNKYTIKETASILGISTNKLRFYEKKGLIKPQRNKENNYRYFHEDDLIKIQAILMYRLLNISIEDIKNIMQHSDKHNMLKHFHKQWEIINSEMHRMRLIQNCLEEIMDTIYESSNEKYINKIISSTKKMNEVKSIKENWNDKWNFDSWAETYDHSVKADTGSLKIYSNYEEILDTVYEKAINSIDKNSSILEIGVGTGNLASKFSRHGFNIIGIDQSREMIKVAKEKYPKLKLRLGDFLKLPFENKTFDVIVSTYAFHHLNDEEKVIAIRELLRVLKPIGKIIIGDLMFKNQSSKNELMKTLTEEQICTIEDEYYSDIEMIEEEFLKYDSKINVTKIDRFNFIVEVN